MYISKTTPINSLNVSSHIMDGKIPVYIDSDVKIDLLINDVENLISFGLDIGVDLHKWQEVLFKFQNNCIQFSSRGSILSSLQANNVLSYDYEDNQFYISLEDIDDHLSDIISSWKNKTPKSINMIEHHQAEFYKKSNKKISAFENCIIFEDKMYTIQVHNKKDFLDTIKTHIHEYFQDSITFMENRETTQFEFSLEEFKKIFNDLMSKDKISRQEAIDFVEWTCCRFNTEVVDI
jgi:hypothetical protein